VEISVALVFWQAITGIPYIPHYRPTVYIFFTPFFTEVYIVEQLMLQTLYVLSKEIFPFLGLKICGL
jgi:hypothetical protein